MNAYELYLIARKIFEDNYRDDGGDEVTFFTWGFGEGVKWSERRKALEAIKDVKFKEEQYDNSRVH